MFDLNGDSSECFQEANFLDDDKISSSSLESLIFLDSDSGINITRNDSRL